MAYAPKQLYQGQPGTSATTLYTVGEGETTILKEIVLCNTDGEGTSLVSVSIVPKGGSPSDANRIVQAWPVPPRMTLVAQFSTVFEDEAFLSAEQTEEDAVTLTVSGVEV